MLNDPPFIGLKAYLPDRILTKYSDTSYFNCCAQRGKNDINLTPPEVVHVEVRMLAVDRDEKPRSYFVSNLYLV